MTRWPRRGEELEALQRRLGALEPEPWRPGEAALAIGGVFFTSPTGTAEGERVWVGACVLRGREELARAVVRGTAPAPYLARMLALREGSLLEEAIGATDPGPDVLLVNASGRDHPRRAGVALHLGWALDLPTVGVTDRPLLAEGPEPGPRRDDAAPLLLDGELVGHRVRSRRGAKPLVVHAAWRTDADVALDVVARALARARTPEPVRRARHLARVERARDEGRLPPGWRDTPLVTRG